MRQFSNHAHGTTISSITWESLRNADSQLLNQELWDGPSDLFFYTLQMVLMFAVRVTGIESLDFGITCIWV